MCVIGIGILAFLSTFLCSWLVCDKETSSEIIRWVDENSKAINIISFSGSVLLAVIQIILEKVKVLSTDEEYIIKKLKTKYK